MAIPISMLWRVQMSLRKKVALVGIFSLAIITCVFAIIRVTVIITLTHQPNISWTYMWSSLEQCIGKRPFLLLENWQRREATGLIFTFSHNRCQPCIFQDPVHTASVSPQTAEAQYHKRLQEHLPSRDPKAAPIQWHIEWAHWSL